MKKVPFAATWMELVRSMLAEISQKWEKKVLNDFTYRYNIGKWNKGSEKRQNLQAYHRHDTYSSGGRVKTGEGRT